MPVVTRMFAALSVVFAGFVAGAEPPVDFAHDVLPLLKARCAECHTNGNYKGSYSLDTREAALEAGAIEVGKSVVVDAESGLHELRVRMPHEHRLVLESRFK